jgi:hypothetical protein
MKEYGGSSAGALARVLEIEFGAPHDMVYEALSVHYAFPVYKKTIEEISERQLEACKSVLDSMRRDSDEEFKRKLLFHKILPFGLQKGSRDILKVLASDPTNQVIQDITARTQFKRIEIFWAPLKTIDDIIERKKMNSYNFWKMPARCWEIWMKKT